MNHAKIALLAATLLVSAVGCQTAATRAWQQADLPTHDRQRAFDAARAVLGKHFEIAEASWTKGTIETKPQLIDRKKAGTLADFRGAGGRWRRTVSFELSSSELTVVGMVAVRLEREGTDQAVAIARSGGYETHAVDAPSSEPFGMSPNARPGQQVWVEVGYDKDMAREILAEIGERVGGMEKADAPPAVATPKEEAEEMQKLGAEPKR
jgi:hypothetical protein